MNKKEHKKKHANDKRIKVINEIAGIVFVKFKPIDEIRDLLPPPVGNTWQPWQELGATKEHDDEIVTKWIIEMLKSEEVAGKLVLGFSNRELSGVPDLAEVILSSSYEWVSPLWKYGLDLYLQSFERGFSWYVFSFDDRYAFLKNSLKKVKHNIMKDIQLFTRKCTMRSVELR